MKSISDLGLMFECEDCGKKYDLSSGSCNLTHKKEYQINGQTIYLTYYDCQSCGRRHFVQIDDEKSLELLEINKSQFVHNAVLKTSGKKLRKKKIDQYKDTKKHLANYRIELMKKFTGSNIYDEDKGEFELRFSV